jgi:hypothetical protein
MIAVILFSFVLSVYYFLCATSCNRYYRVNRCLVYYASLHKLLAPYITLYLKIVRHIQGTFRVLARHVAFCLLCSVCLSTVERERERETNRSGWSHVAGSRNAYSYGIRGINKRACLYSRYFFCSKYMIVRERDGLIAGCSRWFTQRLLVRDTWPI